jgi:DNA-binding transcriptional MerR regulator
MSTTYRIAEVAERSGFRASTLRYYEEVGILPTPSRTARGYRVYGEDVLDRLAFVARAKELGCTLPEIADLLVARDTDRCAPVQSRLRELVGAKITGAERRAAEIVAFTAELRQAKAALEQHTPDGPCDDRCGCTATPVACTLDVSARPARIAEWHDLLGHVVAREAVDGGMRLTFGAAGSVDAERIAALVVKEQACCQFFRFALTIDERGVALEVRAPDNEIVDALFGG